MLKENLAGLEDGVAVDEKDIATAVCYMDRAVIYTDDQGRLFYQLLNDPHMLDIGTVERKSSLTPIEQADAALRTRILMAVKEMM